MTKPLSSIRDWELFTLVAKTLSVRQAAQRADLSPSVVSRRIAALEKRIGETLLVRTARGSALTPKGAEYARRLAYLGEELALAERAGEGGSITIRLAPPVDADPWVKATGHWIRTYGELSVSLLRSAEELPADISVEYCSGEVPPDALALTLPAVCAASPHTLGERGVPTSPAQLERFVTAAAAGTRTVLTRGERTFPCETSRFAAPDWETLVASAVWGGTVAMGLPLRLAAPHLQTGALMLVLPEWHCKEITLAVRCADSRTARGLVALARTAYG